MARTKKAAVSVNAGAPNRVATQALAGAATLVALERLAEVRARRKQAERDERAALKQLEGAMSLAHAREVVGAGLRAAYLCEVRERVACDRLARELGAARVLEAARISVDAARELARTIAPDRAARIVAESVVVEAAAERLVIRDAD